MADFLAWMDNGVREDRSKGRQIADFDPNVRTRMLPELIATFIVHCCSDKAKNSKKRKVVGLNRSVRTIYSKDIVQIYFRAPMVTEFAPEFPTSMSLWVPATPVNTMK